LFAVFYRLRALLPARPRDVRPQRPRPRPRRFRRAARARARARRAAAEGVEGGEDAESVGELPGGLCERARVLGAQPRALLCGRRRAHDLLGREGVSVQ
jgi:hypothetical protein